MSGDDDYRWWHDHKDGRRLTEREMLLAEIEHFLEHGTETGVRQALWNAKRWIEKQQDTKG